MKENVFSYLNNINIPFEVLDHAPVFTMEDMVNEGLDKKCTLCKNLFLRDAKGKNHFLVVASMDTAIDLKKLSGILESSKLSFASDERLSKYLGVKQGCVSPFGIINDENKEVHVIIDHKLYNEEKLGVHPNDNTATVIISFTSLIQFLKSSGNSYKIEKL